MHPPSSDIEARLRAFQATADPAALWPHVGQQDRRTAHARIAAVTRTVLNGAAKRVTLDGASDIEVAATGVSAFASGMGALLGHWIERGVVDAAPSLAVLLARHLDHGRRRAATLGVALRRIIDALQKADITATVFKGAHTARGYFPEPGTRPASDIDLLVRPNQFDRAREVLRAIDLTERRQAINPTRSEWIPTGQSQEFQSLELDHADNPWSVDLHVDLARQYFRGRGAGFGTPTGADLASWEFEGRQAQILAQPLLTAYLALNASYSAHELRLLHLAELAFVIRQDTSRGHLRWTELADLLASTGTARFVYPALELAERLVPGTIDPLVRQQITAVSTSRMRHVVDAIDATGLEGFMQRSLTDKLMWARGPRELVQNVSEVLWPTVQPSDSSSRWATYGRRLKLLLGGRVMFSLRRSENRGK
jgi:hypothetical protein